MVSGGNASSLPLVGGKPEPTIKELSSPGRRAANFPKLESHILQQNYCVKVGDYEINEK